MSKAGANADVPLSAGIGSQDGASRDHFVPVQETVDPGTAQRWRRRRGTLRIRGSLPTSAALPSPPSIAPWILMTSPAHPGRPGAWPRLQQRLGVKTESARLDEHEILLPELADPIAYIEARMAAAGNSDLPYWTKIWPGAIVLASFLAKRELSPGRVLELGAGLGIPGLICALRGSTTVLSDLEPDALEFARAAVELNGLEDRVSVIPLDWNAPPDGFGTFSTVLGSEILYHPPLYPALISLLDRILTPGGTVYIAHEQRPFRISFFDEAHTKLTVHTTSCRVRPGPGQEPVRVYLHALSRRAEDTPTT